MCQVHTETCRRLPFPRVRSQKESHLCPGYPAVLHDVVSLDMAYLSGIGLIIWDMSLVAWLRPETEKPSAMGAKVLKAPIV